MALERLKQYLLKSITPADNSLTDAQVWSLVQKQERRQKLERYSRANKIFAEAPHNLPILIGTNSINEISHSYLPKYYNQQDDLFLTIVSWFLDRCKVSSIERMTQPKADCEFGRLSGRSLAHAILIRDVWTGASKDFFNRNPNDAKVGKYNDTVRYQVFTEPQAFLGNEIIPVYFDNDDTYGQSFSTIIESLTADDFVAISDRYTPDTKEMLKGRDNDFGRIVAPRLEEYRDENIDRDERAILTYRSVRDAAFIRFLQVTNNLGANYNSMHTTDDQFHKLFARAAMEIMYYNELRDVSWGFGNCSSIFNANGEYVLKDLLAWLEKKRNNPNIASVNTNPTIQL
jgi:hypothetical protein